ncbi:hypothetical protein VUR80DRAFT_3259 [Thermomyces stellatus]
MRVCERSKTGGKREEVRGRGPAGDWLKAFQQCWVLVSLGCPSSPVRAVCAEKARQTLASEAGAQAPGSYGRSTAVCMLSLSVVLRSEPGTRRPHMRDRNKFDDMICRTIIYGFRAV